MRPLVRYTSPLDRTKLIQLVHVQAHALGLSEDVRRDLQRQATGCESCKDMDIGQLRAVLGRLNVLADAAGLALPRPPRKRARDERLPAEAPTKEQLELIEHLYDHLGVRPSGQMMGLCRKITGHPWPQNRAEAIQLIEGLRAMDARGWRARATGPDAGVAAGAAVGSRDGAE